MEQKEFTEYIIPKLLEQFPEFIDFCTNKPNDIIDIDYNSKNGNLTLWITTQDKEITIGFTGKNALHDWHTHMSLLGANTMQEELIEAVRLVSDIINDDMVIVHSSVLGYSILRDVEDIMKYKEENEIIKTVLWSEL